MPALPSFAEPAVSPDGSEIAFVSGGDIWTVPASGGQARLLVSHPANDTHPVYSPDGKGLAFVSNRSGNGDIYFMGFDAGEVRRLTYDDAGDQLDGFSRDGKWVYFSTAGHDIGGGMNDVYRVSLDGGTPMPVVADLYGNEFAAAPSPDGTIVAFCGGGSSREWWRKGHSHFEEREIWLMRDSSPPTFKRFTDPGAVDSWPMWRPDGRALYYVSDRDGAQNLYVKTLAGEVRPLTHFRDGNLLWPSISGDGRTIVFERNFGLWRLDLAGNPAGPAGAPGAAAEVPVRLRGAPAGTAVEHVAFANQFSELALSGDGKKVAFAVRGKIFAASARDGGEAVRLTRSPTAIESHATWSHDSRRLAYLSDRDGTRHVYLFDFPTGREYRLTRGPGDDSTPKFSPDDNQIAFERDGREMRLVDLNTRRERLLASGHSFARAPFDYSVSPFAWSPKGEWIAFISVGPMAFDNVYVVPTGEASRPAGSRTAATGPSLLPSPRPTTAAPASGPVPAAAPTTAASATQAVAAWMQYLSATRPAPAGPTAPVPNAGATPNADAPPPKPRQVTFLANTGSNSVSWGADGAYLLFGTGHRTEEYGLARIDLIPRTPHFREDQFRDLFRDLPRPAPNRVPVGPPADPRPPVPVTSPATSPSTFPSAAPSSTFPSSATAAPATPPPASGPSADEPLKIVFDGIRQRLALLPVGLNVGSQALSPDGRSVLLTATSAGQQNLYLYPLDDAKDPVARQLTSTAGAKSHAQFAPDGKEVYYLEQGRISVVALDTRVVRPLNVTAEMDVDFAVEKHEIFRQAWTYLRDNFFDPNFNGVDWEEVRARYAPRAAGARTTDELRRLLSLMVGELNASHVGVYLPNAAARPSTGRLGLSFDRAEYERRGRLRVAGVAALGPAAVAGIKAGDEVILVDGQAVTSRTNLDALLEQKTGKRVVLAIASSGGGTIRPVPLLAIDSAAERTLLYRAWVESRREYVDRASAGRLGYVHIADMSEAALARLNNDLDSETQQRQGVVVDLRNNRGGFVNGVAVDVFARRNYLTMTQRNQPSGPSRLVLGQRALGLPTVLLINRFTISDGEDFTEGYRALKLGKVVGEPTAGAVIFTSIVSLIDGTRFALPETAVVGADGTPLEMHPRPVDVRVDRPVGESYTPRDAQLDAAVAELLKELVPAKTAPPATAGASSRPAAAPAPAPAPKPASSPATDPAGSR